MYHIFEYTIGGLVANYAGNYYKIYSTGHGQLCKCKWPFYCLNTSMLYFSVFGMQFCTPAHTYILAGAAH